MMTSQIRRWGGFLIAVGVLAVAAPSVLAGPQSADANTWTGVVSDGNCGLKHSKASDEAAMCVKKCVSSGAKYVLVSHGKVYQLTEQDKFADFAGKEVTVSGVLKGKTIEVASVEAPGD